MKDVISQYESVMRRHEEFLSRMPAFMGSSFLSHRHREERGISSPQPDFPFWFHLVTWLSKGGIRNRHDDHFLQEVHWGQYCLYSSFKILDAVLDREADTPSLRLSSVFETEGHRVFSSMFPEANPFWKEYRCFLSESHRFILESDRVLTLNTYSRDTVRRMYASASALFKVTVAAFHAPHFSQRQYRSHCRAVDHLVIAGQLIDDLADIVEDLRLGKLNFATRLILNRARVTPSSKGLTEAIGRKIMWGTGIDTFSYEVLYHVKAAYRLLSSLGLPEIREYLSAYDKWVTTLGDELHRFRVNTLVHNLPKHGSNFSLSQLHSE